MITRNCHLCTNAILMSSHTAYPAAKLGEMNKLLDDEVQT